MPFDHTAQPNATSAPEPSIKVLRPADFPGVELELSTHLPPMAIPKLATSGVEFMVVRRGSARVRYLGQTYTYRHARDVFVRHSLEEAITGQTLERSSYHALRLSGQTERRLAAVLGLTKLPVITEPFASVSTSSSLLHLTSEVMGAFTKPHTQLEREVRLLRLLRFNIGTMSPDEDERRHEPLAVKTIRDFIQAHPERDLSLAKLAQLTDLNAAYAAQVFRRVVGATPSAYQRGVRVERAKTLLLRHASADVAQRLGFADQSHFIRIFKRYAYVTPGQFQRDNAGR